MAKKKKKSKRKKHVYLGVRVPDVGPPGLSSLSEVRGIVRAIELDFRLRRIPKTLALRRLAILKLSVMRDKDFQDPQKRAKAIELIDRARKRIKNTPVRGDRK